MLVTVVLHQVRSAFARFQENLFDFFIAQSSQRFEPPQNPGRFKKSVGVNGLIKKLYLPNWILRLILKSPIKLMAVIMFLKFLEKRKPSKILK